jgi:hypothetical protein
MKNSAKWIKAAEQQKITGIAVPGDTNFAILHLPRSWTGKRIFVMTQEYYEELKGRRN